MQLHGHLGRWVVGVVLVLGLAACGGRPAGGTTATTDAGPTPPTSAATSTVTSAATVAASATPATAAPTLDLPDLSAAQTDLGTIDGALASDAAAPSDEGSDK